MSHVKKFLLPPRRSTAFLVAALLVAGAGAARADAPPPTVLTWNDPLNVFPATLAYTPSGNYDADYCELYVNGFGRGNSSVDGATVDWLEAYISVPAQFGTLLNVGMYTRAQPGGVVTDTITLGTAIAPNYWKTGFTTYRNYPGKLGGASDAPVIDFAFFVDVRRPGGEVVRLWQSNHGSNYDPTKVFALPPSGEVFTGTGSIVYASNDSYLFYQRRACQ